MKSEEKKHHQHLHAEQEEDKDQQEQVTQEQQQEQTSNNQQDTAKQQEQKNGGQNQDGSQQQVEEEKTEAEQAEQEQEGKKKDKEKDKKKKKEKEKAAEKSDREKLAELQDRYLRLQAEYDNYRKRTLKEKMELTRSAGEDILKGLLPVMDDFERAIKSIDEAENAEAFKDGVHLIYNKFKEFLNQQGVKEMESQDQNFDTDKHEAISKVPAPSEEMKGKVVDVVQTGYYLNDKVLRYAKVVVGE